MIANNELEKIGKEAVMGKFGVFFQHFPEATEENDEEPQ
jgi:hypothetical protein